LDSSTEQRVGDAASGGKRPIERSYPEPKYHIREKFIDCHYGPANDKDYGWHFAPWHTQRPFGSDLKIPCQIIYTHLAPKIPKAIKVVVELPPQFWEKKIITVIAKDALNTWGFNEDYINKVIPDIIEGLNHYVDTMGKQNRRSY